jgi:hypothetical protein
MTPVYNQSVDYNYAPQFDRTLNRTWDDRNYDEPPMSADLHSVKSSFETLVAERHKSYSKEIHFLTEKLGYLEAK